MVESRQGGFTLIELLIVVVIIGILAAIAVPKFGSTKGKAYVSQMKSDLRNLAVAQEAYFYDNTTYTTSLVALQVVPSGGVTITVTEETGAGWSATATHSELPAAQCAVIMGAAAPVGPATQEGLIACS